MVTFILCLISFVIGAFIARSKEMSLIRQKNEDLSKIVCYYNIFNFWLDSKQSNLKVNDYIEKEGYKRVIIYGMKELGARLYAELVDAGVEIVCVIDQNKNIMGDFDVISPEDDIPEADICIVTAEYYFDSIKKKLSDKVNCPIITLSGFLGNCFHRGI